MTEPDPSDDAAHAAGPDASFDALWREHGPWLRARIRAEGLHFADGEAERELAVQTVLRGFWAAFPRLRIEEPRLLRALLLHVVRRAMGPDGPWWCERRAHLAQSRPAATSEPSDSDVREDPPDA